MTQSNGMKFRLYCLKPTLFFLGTAVGLKTLITVRTLRFPSNLFSMFSFNASTYLMVKFLSCSSMQGDMIVSLHL